MPTPERTTLPAIVASARELLERRGPAGVTMQAVAERVGVRAPSLYKRVRDRDELLRLVAENAASDLSRRFAATDGSVTELAHAYRAFARANPMSFRLLLDSESAGAFRDVADPILEATRSLDAARVVTAWATGFLTMELAGAFRLGGDLDEAYAYGLDTIVAGLRRPV
ncbi:TetR family transcriptional regulator [Microbacterium sp. SLBN-154]|uniref:TetR/AcrR family transcriptional regulator n=1 Tax=Microbacterium sp. SLBN-154 TaxID=2768458 RepID=UPI0011517326|nr:TetR/AcrR family transcriptional regulator [Microbacterium sp. SLBN-154]TQK18751.1 TetR family transcriptional regulator [Microbacterium sp. SLBN-154]